MKKILIAEDDRNLAGLIQKMLEKEGFTTKVAYEGASTLKEIKEFRPDLLILDIMMPIVDGYNVCKILQEDIKYHPLPKIIVVTIRKDEWDKRISSFLGVDAFINKPFKFEEVLSTVKKLLTE